MKRIAALLALLSVLLTSCAATLIVRGTAPVQDNSGTCIAPILGPRSGATMMHFAWTGPAVGEDSISTVAGTQVTLTRNGVPAGIYTIRAWASDSGGAGCDTSIVLRFGGPPKKPIISP